MRIANDLSEAIGKTPLIRLNKASEETGCTILGKAEFTNPGQSVKDRAALFIIKDAIASGALKPGGTIVEGTAGKHRHWPCVGRRINGVQNGHRHSRNAIRRKEGNVALGGGPSWFRCLLRLIVIQTILYAIPEDLPKNLPEPNQTGRFGPTSSTTLPTVKRTSKQQVPRYGSRPVAKLTGSFVPWGLAELWPEFHMSCSQKGVKIGLADPDGAALYNFYTKDELSMTDGGSINEGIGQVRITENLKGFKPDFSYNIHDSEALPVVFDILKHEGPVFGRLVRRSTLRARCAWPAIWDRAIRS